MTDTYPIVSFPHPVASVVWQVLSDLLVKEANILASRVVPESLQGVYEQGLALVIFNQDQPIGFFAVWPVEEGFAELGSAWVHPDYRGLGLGKQLYDNVFHLEGADDLLVFAISKNPVAIHLSKRAGFQVLTDWEDPVPWRLTCGPCTWVKECDKAKCSMRNEPCSLRVRVK